jgi:hypothetical protein
MDRHNAIQVDALFVLVGDNFKFRMFENEAFPTQSRASMDDHSYSGENTLLNMEQIEPSEENPPPKSRVLIFQEFRFEATHSPKASEYRFAHNAAETERAFALTLTLWKMVKASSIFMASGIMLQEIA